MVTRVSFGCWLLAIGWLSGCQKQPEPVTISSPGTNGLAWFADISERAGVNFIHDAGVTGRYRVPEQMGSGVALFDFDNDGRLDIYLIQNGGPASRATNRLLHQEADGKFKDVSAGSGLDVAGFGMGVAVGDINNDGWPDVLVTEYGGARLFLNRGNGTFTDITQAAGLDNPRWAMSAAFFDYDRDGWLDLVIANYLDYDPTQNCTDAVGVPEFCGPHGFPGTVTRLFHNRGATGGPPRFDDVSVSSGLARVPGPALGVLCADFDGDHWPDIFLADDGRPNRLFINRHDGTFAEEAAARGLAYNAMGQIAGNMGVALGDIDGDGLFDLFVTHLAEEQHALWRQGPRGVFQDHAAGAGLANPRWRGTGFGAALIDFDLDGALDLAFVNGLVKRRKDAQLVERGVAEFWISYAQRNQLFANDGRGNFRDVSVNEPAFCGNGSVGRGLAWGDVDNDGAIDLLATSCGGPAKLFRNVAPRRGHWLTVRALDPTAGQRDAYGAEITVQAGGKKWWRLLQPGSSYLCSNDPRVHFGLGAATGVDAIQVFWPDGVTENFPGGGTDRLIVLRKGAGQKVP